MTHHVLTRKVRQVLGRPPDLVDYWNRRATAHGRRAVLNIAHSEQEYDAVTEAQRHHLLPYLRSALDGHERVVLDFGCGPGRFTPDLADAIHGTAVGVDPVRRLLDLAPRAANVRYIQSDGHSIPLPDDSIDVVWICLVLGGIRDLDETTAEVHRVARPMALVLVVENTSVLPDLEHWFYRRAEEYADAFDTPLEHVGGYVDEGETISVLRGRM